MRHTLQILFTNSAMFLWAVSRNTWVDQASQKPASMMIKCNNSYARLQTYIRRLRRLEWHLSSSRLLRTWDGFRQIFFTSGDPFSRHRRDKICFARMKEFPGICGLGQAWRIVWIRLCCFKVESGKRITWHWISARVQLSKALKWETGMMLLAHFVRRICIII